MDWNVCGWKIPLNSFQAWQKNNKNSFFTFFLISPEFWNSIAFALSVPGFAHLSFW
jgi:hypothetical protein